MTHKLIKPGGEGSISWDLKSEGNEIKVSENVMVVAYRSPLSMEEIMDANLFIAHYFRKYGLIDDQKIRDIVDEMRLEQEIAERIINDVHAYEVKNGLQDDLNSSEGGKESPKKQIVFILDFKTIFNMRMIVNKSQRDSYSNAFLKIITETSEVAFVTDMQVKGMMKNLVGGIVGTANMFTGNFYPSITAYNKAMLEIGRPDLVLGKLELPAATEPGELTVENLPTELKEKLNKEN